MSDLDGWPNPKKWHFEEATGEFYRITGHVKGNAVYVVEPYARRVVKVEETRRYFRLAAGGLAVSVAGVVICWYLADTLPGGPNNFNWGLLAVIFGVFAFAAVGATFLRTLPLYLLALRNLGPAPRPRKTEDFGPGSATSAPDHPAGDDLEYKPTA